MSTKRAHQKRESTKDATFSSPAHLSPPLVRERITFQPPLPLSLSHSTSLQVQLFILHSLILLLFYLSSSSSSSTSCTDAISVSTLYLCRCTVCAFPAAASCLTLVVLQRVNRSLCQHSMSKYWKQDHAFLYDGESCAVCGVVWCSVPSLSASQLTKSFAHHCSVASGNPLPQITWTLDESPLTEAWHIRVGDYVTDVYTVNSYVNISSSKTEDGGVYSCSAKNSAGSISKSARVNVLGPPFIRPMSNLTALSGQTVHIYCPYAGHPIQGIHWIKGKRETV